MEFTYYIAENWFFTALIVLVAIMGLCVYLLSRHDIYSMRRPSMFPSVIVLILAFLMIFSLLVIKTEMIEEKRESEESGETKVVSDWGNVMVYDYEKEKYVIY